MKQTTAVPRGPDRQVGSDGDAASPADGLKTAGQYYVNPDSDRHPRGQRQRRAAAHDPRDPDRAGSTAEDSPELAIGESADPASELPPTGYISGRVVSDDGAAVVGAQIVTTALHLFEAPATPTPADLQRQGMTDSAGQFFFDALLDGEYRLDVLPPETGLGRGQLVTRTGVTSADIVLARVRQLVVAGAVTNGAGEPLSGALVQPRSAGARAVYTDGAGRFSLSLPMAAQNGTVALRAELIGYRSKLSVIRVGAAPTANVAIVLEPAARTAMVAGVVHAADSGVLAGRSVQLLDTTARRRYSATTDETGRFLMPAVELDARYDLIVAGGAGYAGFVQSDLPIDIGGLELQIVLELDEALPLRGRMVDTNGHPVPHYSLTVRAQHPPYQAMRVTSDSAGQFALPAPPPGPLLFESRLNPAVVVIAREGYGGDELVLVLDVGVHEIVGRVVDPNGRPVPAQITAIWERTANGVRSHFAHRGAANGAGQFRFTGLGPGPHLVTVEAPGYPPTRVRHDAARDGYYLDITLQSGPAT